MNILNINAADFEISEDSARYPGGKSRALSKLFQYIPDLKDYKEYREPFLGGGSVALEITKRYPQIGYLGERFV